MVRKRNGSCKRRQRYYTVRDVEDPSANDWKSSIFPSTHISVPLMEWMIRTVLTKENVSTTVQTFSQISSTGGNVDTESILIPVFCSKKKVWILVRVEKDEESDVPIFTVHNTVRGHRLSRRRLRSRMLFEMKSILRQLCDHGFISSVSVDLSSSLWKWPRLPSSRGLEADYFLLLSVQRIVKMPDREIRFTRYESWRLRQYLSNWWRVSGVAWVYDFKTREWYRVRISNVSRRNEMRKISLFDSGDTRRIRELDERNVTFKGSVLQFVTTRRRTKRLHVSITDVKMLRDVLSGDAISWEEATKADEVSESIEDVLQDAEKQLHESCMHNLNCLLDSSTETARRMVTHDTSNLVHLREFHCAARGATICVYSANKVVTYKHGRVESHVHELRLREEDSEKVLILLIKTRQGTKTFLTKYKCFMESDTVFQGLKTFLENRLNLTREDEETMDDAGAVFTRIRVATKTIRMQTSTTQTSIACVHSKKLRKDVRTLAREMTRAGFWGSRAVMDLLHFDTERGGSELVLPSSKKGLGTTHT